MTTFMTGRAAERISYLALALEARRAIKGLKASAGTEEVPAQVRAAIQSAVNSIKALASPGKLYSELHDEGGYDRSEAIQTLTEVADQVQVAAFLTGLEAILAGKSTPDSVNSAIQFFSAIEKQALYHYDDPSLAEAG